jgi:hypothetical protein
MMLGLFAHPWADGTSDPTIAHIKPIPGLAGG